MNDRRYAQTLMEGFVRAIPWAIVFSAAFVLTAGILASMISLLSLDLVTGRIPHSLW